MHSHHAPVIERRLISPETETSHNYHFIGQQLESRSIPLRIHLDLSESCHEGKLSLSLFFLDSFWQQSDSFDERHFIGVVELSLKLFESRVPVDSLLADPFYVLSPAESRVS